MSSLFKVVDVGELDAERDVFMGLPVESTNKQTYHRVPIRSSSVETPDDRKVSTQFVPGSKSVVQNCRGLRRLALRFHPVFAPGIKVYDSVADEPGSAAPRTNMSFGFSMYDHRNGPTPEEERVMQNIDNLSAFIRNTLMSCEKLRTKLKLGPSGMSPEQQQLSADMLDLHIVRPVLDAQGSSSRRPVVRDGEERANSRYCYVKVVPNEGHIPEVFRTYFWTPDGKPIPHSTVLQWKNFQAIPVVEVEDIFVNKAMRSIQLKLRECIITPPLERMTRRPSVLFPAQLCCADATSEFGDEPEDDGPDAKRQKPSEAEAPAKEEEETD